MRKKKCSSHSLNQINKPKKKTTKNILFDQYEE